jgi:hypothetical protein
MDLTGINWKNTSNILFDENINYDEEYNAVDIKFDVLWFWNDVDKVINFLLECNLTPIEESVKIFCASIADTNQQYFDMVNKCFTIAQDVLDNKNYDCELTFFETAMIRSILLQKTNISRHDFLILNSTPACIADFKKLFKENNHG